MVQCDELNREQMHAVIRQAAFCHMGLCDNNQPYVLPVCAEFECRKGRELFLVKSINNGMAMRCLRANTKVCLQFDCASCDGIKSVVVFGCVKEIIPPSHRGDCCGCQRKPDPKVHLIKIVCTKMTGKHYHC